MDELGEVAVLEEVFEVLISIKCSAVLKQGEEEIWVVWCNCCYILLVCFCVLLCVMCVTNMRSKR